MSSAALLFTVFSSYVRLFSPPQETAVKRAAITINIKSDLMLKNKVSSKNSLEEIND